MSNEMSLEEASLIEDRMTKSVKILLKKIELEHSIKVRDALHYVAQKLRITAESDSST